MFYVTFWRLQSSSSLDDSSPTDLLKDTHTINCRNVSTIVSDNIREINEQ